jgi:hypothetical protein
MEKEYNLGKYGVLKMKEFNGPDSSIIASCIRNNTNYDYSGKDKYEVENNLLTLINREKNELLIQASELEELALRIKESGLEKTSQYYKDKAIQHNSEKEELTK